MNTQDEDTTPATLQEGPPGQPGQIIGTSAFRYPLYPNPINPAMHEVAVLKRGAVDDYAVYVAMVPEGIDFGRDSEAARWVTGHGTKASFEDALRHFPSLRAKHYRR